jgi:hypothetical protein
VQFRRFLRQNEARVASANIGTPIFEHKPPMAWLLMFDDGVAFSHFCSVGVASLFPLHDGLQPIYRHMFLKGSGLIFV